MRKVGINLLRVFTFLSLFSARAQNPASSIATFKNDALGAYNIIHDDFGDYGVIGINDYVDTMTFNRKIKITFGAITSSCEGNPGMYAKAKSMINDHNHEIINHSHTHSCAVANSSCGGTGSSYRWGEAGYSDKLNIEVNQSTQSILNNTGVQPRFFIYPYDQFTEIANARMESLGYIGSRTGAYNAASPNNLAPSATGFFRTPVVVDAADNGSGMVIAQNLNYWVDQAINNKQWVNRELHNVGNSGWGSVTVANYRTHLNYVKQKMDAGQLWVGTISEILTYQMQKLKYTPTATYASASKTITVNWNTPTFNVEQYLQPLKYKSPITLKVDVSNAAHVGSYNISQNGITVTDYKKVGTNLLINVYPHQGPVQIKIIDCASLCIATQPASTSVTEGTLLTLVSQASAPSGTTTYQWYKNNTLLNGETNATLSINSASLSDAGTYYVVVTNGANTLTSSSAIVTIIANPCLRLCINSQPVSASVNIGTAATFSVSAQGVQPITYQWYKNNVLMNGQTSANLTIPATVAGDATTYKVVLTNSTGSVTSDNATLTLYNQTPYNGSPIAIPGKLEAEHFDNGGQNIAYYDNTPGSQFTGITFRNNTDVDLNNCTDAGGGYNVGYFSSGEWLEYTVNVAATGNYNFVFRTASVNDGQPNGIIKLELDGQVVLASQSVPFTGSWTTYGNVTASNVPLTAGVHVLKLTAVNGDFDFNYVQVNASSLLMPSITFDNINKTYGDGIFNLAATSNSSGAITYSATGTGATVTPSGQVTITGAGTVTITATQAANGSFSGGTATATLTISKNVLQVTAENKSRPYNTPNPVFTFTYNGFVGSDNISAVSTLPTATTSAVTNSPAGSYSIIPSGAVADNYTFSYVNGTLTINDPIVPTISFAAVNKVYGDAAFSMTAGSNSAGAITYSSSNTLLATVNSTSGLVTIKGAGTVIITATQAAAGSYSGGLATANLVIGTRNLTITADNKSKAYNTANPALTFTYGAFAYSDNSSSLTTLPTISTTAQINSQPGSYPITVSGAVSSNYTFTYVGANLVIESALTPTISFAAVNKVYGDAAFLMTAGSNSAGAITYSSSNTLLATVNSTSGLVTIKGAGTVIITATQAAAGSYSGSLATANLVIAKKNLTLTVDNKSKAYNTANPVLTFNYSTFAYSDNASSLTTLPTISTTAQTNSQPGSYPITVSGAVSSNYTFTYVNGNLTVNSASAPQLTFTSPGNKTYGDAPFAMTAGSNSGGTITYSSSNTSIASINSATGMVDIIGAGTVIITANQLASGSFSNGSTTITLNIEKKLLTVTADNKSRRYNTINPELTVSYAGFVNNENENILQTKPVATTAAVQSSSVGTYQINLSTAVSDNYNFVYNSGILTIEPGTATLDLSFASAGSGTIGDVITLAINSPSDGTVVYTIINITGTASLSGNQLTLLTNGTVIVTAHVAASGNYSSGSISQEITISSTVTSVDDATLATHVKLYPVPASEYLTIEANSTLSKVELLDIESGKTVASTESSFNTNTLNVPVSHLANSIYIAKIYAGENVITRKISVLH